MILVLNNITLPLNSNIYLLPYVSLISTSLRSVYWRVANTFLKKQHLIRELHKIVIFQISSIHITSFTQTSFSGTEISFSQGIDGNQIQSQQKCSVNIYASIYSSSVSKNTDSSLALTVHLNLTNEKRFKLIKSGQFIQPVYQFHNFNCWICNERHVSSSLV